MKYVEPLAIQPLGTSPQLFADVPMLIARYRADPEVIAAALPPGLEPHPGGHVLLNMWELDDPQRATGFGGFGPVSVTYLAIEVAGHDGRSADGEVTAPGRFWVHHWVSNHDVRSYARAVSDVLSEPGETTLEHHGGDVVTTLRIEGRPVARMRASVGEELLHVRSGHSNYFLVRPDADGGGEQLLQLSVPYVARSYDAKLDNIELTFPEGHPAERFAPPDPTAVDALLWRRITFVPYLPYRVLGSTREA
jgi:hypothetical protein